MEQPKTLRDMTLEELWRLFPISIADYDPEWPMWADQEIKNLRDLLDWVSLDIHHIGSTSIIGIVSKPIVDILVVTPDMSQWRNIADLMESHGYILMSVEENRMSLNKGYSIHGYAREVFHIHFHLKGDTDEIIFRNYLLQHPSVAGEYEKLKLSLLPRFKHDRDGYTAAKSGFVNRVLTKAKTDGDQKSEFIVIRQMLVQKMSLEDVKTVASWADKSDENRDLLWNLSLSPDRRQSVNSLWVMTHLGTSSSNWIDTLKPRLILRQLSEEDTSKKRLFLQLLRELEYDADAPLTIRLLDYCLSRINSEKEPYAVRCFSIYTAFKICRSCPELLSELREHLQLLSFQNLSPGLKSALRQTSHRIAKIEKTLGHSDAG